VSSSCLLCSLMLVMSQAKRSLLRYLLVAFFFALGLMAKPMLVTCLRFCCCSITGPSAVSVPARWEMLQNFVPRSTFSRLVAEKVPLFLLSLLSSLLTWWAQRAFMRSTSEIPLVLRAENAIVSYVRYLGNCSGRSIWLRFIPTHGQRCRTGGHRGCCSARRHFGGRLIFMDESVHI